MAARVVSTRVRAISVLTAAALLPLGVGADDPSAAAAWVPRQLLVGLDAMADESLVDDVVRDLGGQVVPQASLDHFERVCGPVTGFGAIRLVQMPSEADTAAAHGALAGLRGVDFVQRNHVVVPTGARPAEDPETRTGGVEHDFAADPLVGGQWAIHNDGRRMGNNNFGADARAGWDIDGLEAWERGATGEGQIIAILDDGAMPEHEDLQPNLWINHDEVAGNGVDDDANGWVDDRHGWHVGPETGEITPASGHGTAVAGIAAARGGNGLGVSGVAPLAQWMPVQFLDTLGDPWSSTEVNALGAFAYAIANGATVINNSWGFPAPVALGSPVMTRAVECAAEKEIVVVWSGGNLYAYPQSFPAYYPAPNVLVASVFNQKGCPGTRHPWNPALIDVLAPGDWIMSTSAWASRYEYFAMSSAAAPHVAGVAALVRQMRPELTAVEVARAIRNGVRAEFVEPWSQSMGYLNAVGALDAPADADRLLPALPGDPAQSSLVRCPNGGYF